LTLYGEGKVKTFVPTVTQNRYFNYFSWDENWNAKYLPKMVEYQVSGDAKDPGSWHETGISYTPPK